MKRRQGLFSLLHAYREDEEKTRIIQVYSLNIERGWREDKDYSSVLLEKRGRREYKDYLGLHWKESGWVSRLRIKSN